MGYEYNQYIKLSSLREGEAYSEYMDTTDAYWFTYMLGKLAPEAKRIIVDDQDDRLFLKIFRDSDAQRTVAVVNHWHVPGIEARWRNVTNTVESIGEINPVGDMDISALSELVLEHDFLDRKFCKNSRSEPATSEQIIVQYMDTTHEHERARHAFFLGADDPHLNHCLYNDENVGVEYLSEEMQGLGDHH